MLSLAFMIIPCIIILFYAHRVELTVNLPKLEPFTRDHHASWVMDSRENSPTEEKASLPCELQC